MTFKRVIFFTKRHKDTALQRNVHKTFFFLFYFCKQFLCQSDIVTHKTIFFPLAEKLFCLDFGIWYCTKATTLQNQNQYYYNTTSCPESLYKCCRCWFYFVDRVCLPSDADWWNFHLVQLGRFSYSIRIRITYKDIRKRNVYGRELLRME